MSRKIVIYNSALATLLVNTIRKSEGNLIASNNSRLDVHATMYLPTCIQGCAKKLMLSSVSKVLFGLMGCVSAV